MSPNAAQYARKKPTLGKLLARCIPEPNSGCLLWEGPLNYKGYGVANDGKNVRLVHRIIWERVKGPVAKGLELDHLCRTRACANTDHLEPVTVRENQLRGLARLYGGSNHRYKTHCPQGHPYSGDNLIIKILPRGTPNRRCRECERQRSARRNKERRALVAGKSPDQQVKDG